MEIKRSCNTKSAHASCNANLMDDPHKCTDPDWTRWSGEAPLHTLGPDLIRARQDTQVELATLVSGQVLGRFEQPPARGAPRQFGWTVDYVAVAPPRLVVAQCRQAVAPHATRFTVVLRLRCTGCLRARTPITLLRCSGRRGPDLLDLGCRRRDEPALDRLRRQQQALIGRTGRLPRHARQVRLRRG